MTQHGESPLSAGCVHSGVPYEHGTKWRPAEKPCDVCSCVVGLLWHFLVLFICTGPVFWPPQEGRARCEREPCSTPCSNPAAPPPNSCCPLCQGKPDALMQQREQGIKLPTLCAFVCQGVGWTGTTTLTALGSLLVTCVRTAHVWCVIEKTLMFSSVLKDGFCKPSSSFLLQNGNVLCSAHPCPSLPCQNPVRRPGDCCPRWPACLYTLKPIPQQRYYWTLSVMISTARDLCVFAHRCEQCEYESKLYVDGQKFSSRTEPCLHCRCSVSSRCPCDWVPLSYINLFRLEILITTASKSYCINSQRPYFLICVYWLGRWGVMWACGLIVSHPTMQPSSYTKGRVLSYLPR